VTLQCWTVTEFVLVLSQFLRSIPVTVFGSSLYLVKNHGFLISFGFENGVKTAVLTVFVEKNSAVLLKCILQQRKKLHETENG